MFGPPPAYSEAISSSCAFSSSSSAAVAAANGHSAANSEPPPIWTIQVPPPDIGERPVQFNGSRLNSLLMFGNMIESLGTTGKKMAQSPSSMVTPPPSYAESLGANPSANSRQHHQYRRCSREGRRGENGCQQSSTTTPSSTLSPICSRNLHRCSSRHRHGRQSRRQNGVNGTDLIFPAEESSSGRITPFGGSRRSSTIQLSGRNLESQNVDGIDSSRPICADRFRDLFLTILMRILLVFLFLVFLRILIAQLSPVEE